MTSSEVWSVSTLEEFLQFCCPECDVKEKSKDRFINHAFIFHPGAKIHLATLITENETYFVSEINVNKNNLDDEENDDAMKDPLESVIFKKEDFEDEVPKSNVEEKYTCEYCGNGTVNLKDHINTFHKDDAMKDENYRNYRNKLKKNKCKFCRKSFLGKSYLKQHIRTVHEGVRKFNCNFCEKSFRKGEHLKRHTEYKHKQLKLNVNKNNLDEQNDNAMKDPFESVMIKEEIFEDEIPKNDVQATTILDNIMNTNEANTITSSNDKKIAELSDMSNETDQVENRNKLKSSAKKVECYICREVFFGPTDLKPHMQTVHRISSKENECAFCGKSFTLEVYLKKHIHAVHEGKIKCDYCGKYVKTENFKDHIDVFHDDKKKNQCYICYICNLMFTESNTLKKHIDMDHKASGKSELDLKTSSSQARPSQSATAIKCVVCNKLFAHFRELNEHVKVYHEYRCKTCRQIFSSEEKLKTHIQEVHPPHCYICRKSFSSAGGLKIHNNKIHT